MLSGSFYRATRSHGADSALRESRPAPRTALRAFRTVSNDPNDPTVDQAFAVGGWVFRHSTTPATNVPAAAMATNPAMTS